MNRLAKNSTTAAISFICIDYIKRKIIRKKNKTERFCTSYVSFQGIPKKERRKKEELNYFHFIFKK